MSTEAIYGGWSTPKFNNIDWIHDLWMKLSAQPGSPNFGLTQRKNEIWELWQLYNQQYPRVVLEIGVAQGGTFAAWCQLGRGDATLIGIDRDLNDCRPRPGDPVNRDIYDGELAMTCNGGGLFSLARQQQDIHAINGWSHEPRVMEELLRVLNGRKIDFLFHDASHQARMFARDFDLYWPLVAEGGVFAAHDINYSEDPKCNKRDAWLEITGRTDFSAHYEYLPGGNVSEMGIGVLIK
jgi:cephalosporin hydroxylase